MEDHGRNLPRGKTWKWDTLVAPPAPLPDGDDIYGLVTLKHKANGEQIWFSGFTGAPTNVPATAGAVPYDLGGIPRAHDVTVRLIVCFSGHNSGVDDTGWSVTESLFNVINAGASSGSVDGCWGSIGHMPRTTTLNYVRPLMDDEGGGPDDGDADNNPSCRNDLPTQADPQSKNHVILSP